MNCLNPDVWYGKFFEVHRNHRTRRDRIADADQDVGHVGNSDLFQGCHMRNRPRTGHQYFGRNVYFYFFQIFFFSLPAHAYCPLSPIMVRIRLLGINLLLISNNFQVFGRLKGCPFPMGDGFRDIHRAPCTPCDKNSFLSSLLRP